MPMIGVRELRERATEILKRVRERKAEYVVTVQGRPVAVLLPIDAEAVEEAMVQAAKRGAARGWAAYAKLIEEGRAKWPPGVGSQDAIDAIRR